MKIAKLFEQLDPEGKPILPLDRQPLNSDERDLVLQFLLGGKIAARTSGRSIDKLDESRGKVVPSSLATDGTWIWSRATAYYLQHHGVAPEPDFLKHIRKCNYTAAQPDPDTLSQAIVTLQSATKRSRGQEPDDRRQPR